MLKGLFGRRAAGETDKSGPAVDPDRRVYAIGDIHGRADLLADLQDMVRRDADKSGEKHKVLVYLGDYVDRGEQSREVLDRLIERPLQGFEIVHLMGNHEAFMIEFLTTGRYGMNWLYNGGVQTLQSYGIAVPERITDDSQLAETRAALEAELPAAHDAFLQRLALKHDEGDYLFVHAGVRPGVDLAAQSPHDLIWIREEFLDSDEDFGRIVVHGHTITRKVDVRDNRIGIDTGAFATGCLTCLVLDGSERHFLQT